MHIAAIRGEYKIIKLLMLFGASPFIYTYNGGLTPLDYAKESGKAESFNILKPLFEEKKSRNNLYQKSEKVIFLIFNQILFLISKKIKIEFLTKLMFIR